MRLKVEKSQPPLTTREPESPAVSSFEDCGKVELKTPPRPVGFAREALLGRRVVVENSLDQDLPRREQEDLVHAIAKRRENLQMLVDLGSLDKDNFAPQLEGILSGLDDGREAYNQVSAKFSQLVNSQTLVADAEVKTAQLTLEQNKRLEQTLLERVRELLNNFCEQNNWSRLVTAWQIMIRPEYHRSVGANNWLEVLATQALQVLGHRWRSKLLELSVQEGFTPAHFFAEYLSSPDYARLSFDAQVREKLPAFLTPILLDYINKQQENYLREQVHLSALEQRVQQLAEKNKSLEEQNGEVALLREQLNDFKEQIRKHAQRQQQEIFLGMSTEQELTSLKSRLSQLQKQQEQLRNLSGVDLNLQTQEKNHELEHKLVLMKMQYDQLLERVEQLRQQNEELADLQAKPSETTPAEDEQVTKLREQVAQANEAIASLQRTNEDLAREVALKRQQGWREQQTSVFPETLVGSEKEIRVTQETLPPLTTPVGAREMSFPRERQVVESTPLPKPQLPELEDALTIPELAAHFQAAQEKLQRLIRLGIGQPRLSEKFPLCKRLGQELCFENLDEQLSRVLGGTMFALERAQARRWPVNPAPEPMTLPSTYYPVRQEPRPYLVA